MNSAEWQQVKEIFQAAIDLPPEQRRDYVRQACGADAELYQEVDSLLAAEESAADFLSQAAASYLPDAAGEERPAAELGWRIGPYQIIREIGSGGMGSVYLAERVDEFRIMVAVKLMRRNMESRLVVSRFRHERQILAGLDHPNIARLLDGGATDDGRPYFVMEYVEGTPIDEFARSHELSVRDRLKLFRQVSAAVQYAHQNLVVHRDIKPVNILVGPDGAPKLLDFGIAKLLRQETLSETAGLTQVGMRLMTPQYASPEQTRGLPVTTSTDIYSLGVVFYQLLTGRVPYELSDLSPAEIERVVCEREPRPPSSLEGDARLSGDLDIIALKALEKDPQRRYHSVEQFSEDIRRHLEGLPIEARPSTFFYRGGKFMRRNRTPVAASVLLLVSLVGGLVATTRQARIARQERGRAEQRFNDVRYLAESFLFEFDDKIKDLAGSTPARQLVIQRALEYLGSLRAEAAGDASLSAEVAEAYLKIGDVQGNPYVSNVGDTKGALSSYQQALAIAAEVVRRDPANLTARQQLAHAHRSMGEVLPLLDDPLAAIPHFRDAIALLEAVPAAARDAKAGSELSRNYEIMGDLLGRPGITNLSDPKGAREAYEKSLAIDEGLEAAHPEDIRLRRATAVIRLKIGDLVLGTGDWGTAVRNYQAAESVLGGLSAADASNAELRRLLAQVERRIGDAMDVAGRPKLALEYYEKASDLHRQLMSADPANARARMDYAVAVKSQGDVASKAGDQKKSLAAYREVLDLLRPLAAAEPDNTMVQSRYGNTLVYVGSTLAALHQNEEARRLYGQGLALTKRLADRPGATPGQIGEYAEDLIDCTLPELRNPQAAVVYAKKAVDLTGERSPEFLELLARAYFDAGDASNAVHYEEKALALLGPSPAKKAAGERLARFGAGLKK